MDVEARSRTISLPRAAIRVLSACETQKRAGVPVHFCIFMKTTVRLLINAISYYNWVVLFPTMEIFY